MKKLFIIVMSAVLCFSSFAFIGCGASDKYNILPDEYDVGYQLNVYPNCTFDYKVNNDCTVTLNDIKITLTQKNIIEENDTILESYYPYVFHIYANASTDPKFAGEKIFLLLIVSEMYKQFFYYETIIGYDGSIVWEYDQLNWTSVTEVYFHSVKFNV